LDTIDLPHNYYITFAALISTGFSLVLSKELLETLITKLSYGILAKNEADFIVNSYLPNLNLAVANLNIAFTDKLDLLRKFIGVIIKIIYSFVWQEGLIHPP
jgi:hypothetical protein